MTSTRVRGRRARLAALRARAAKTISTIEARRCNPMMIVFNSTEASPRRPIPNPGSLRDR